MFERQLLLKQTRESRPDGALGLNEGDMTYMIVTTTRMKPILLHFDLRHPVQRPKKRSGTRSLALDMFCCDILHVPVFLRILEAVLLIVFHESAGLIQHLCE